MNFAEKWNLTDDEWDLISCLPIHTSYIVSKADGVINKEETDPYFAFRELMCLKDDNSALVDICLASKDRTERNIQELQILDDYISNYGLRNEDGAYVRKELVVDHFLRVLNLFDEHNKDKIKEYCFHLALKTAFSYGVPDSPMDINEKKAMNELFNWLEIDTKKYFEQKNRDLFYDYLNNKD